MLQQKAEIPPFRYHQMVLIYAARSLMTNTIAYQVCFVVNTYTIYKKLSFSYDGMRPIC